MNGSLRSWSANPLRDRKCVFSRFHLNLHIQGQILTFYLSANWHNYVENGRFARRRVVVVMLQPCGLTVGSMQMSGSDLQLQHSWPGVAQFWKSFLVKYIFHQIQWACGEWWSTPWPDWGTGLVSNCKSNYKSRRILCYKKITAGIFFLWWIQMDTSTVRYGPYFWWQATIQLTT